MLCEQPDHWSTAALVAKKDACGEKIYEKNMWELMPIMARQIVFTKDTNSITKKCEYFSKNHPPIYKFRGDRFMFNCAKTPDVCKAYQIPELQKGLPLVCNMKQGKWGYCDNRKYTPKKYSLKQLRNRLAYRDTALVQDLLNIADLSESWPRSYEANFDNEFQDAFVQKHRDWWNFHHLASFKQNPLYFSALANFMNHRLANGQSEGGYFCNGCQEHFTNELDIRMSDEASSNVVMALWYLHNQAQWEITSGKQIPYFPDDPDSLRHLKWTFMPTHSECSKCRTMDGWDYQEVQKHLYKEYGQKSSCVSKTSSRSCKREDHCKWNTHWNVCQQKPATDGYAVQTEGTCRKRIRSKSECNEAAKALKMKKTKASRDNSRGKSKSSDPRGCFYEKGELKYNERGNKGKCSDKDICLCKATKSLRTYERPPRQSFPYDAFSALNNSSLFSVAQNILAVFGVLTVAYGAFSWCLGNKGYAQLSEPQSV